MMSVALDVRNPYEDMKIAEDVLFFKLGAPGLVCFHGRNYNIKKRMSAEQVERLVSDNNFFKVSSDCYVNVSKISTIEDDCLFFGEMGPESKRLPVSKRHQQVLKGLLG